MPQTGLGVALKILRERRTLSLLEFSKLSGVDRAYIHRLESGDKINPSTEMIDKILKVLKPNERDAELIKWLIDRTEVDPALIEYAVTDPTIEVDHIVAAAGIRHRGSVRPDPAKLIDRVKRLFEDDDEES